MAGDRVSPAAHTGKVHSARRRAEHGHARHGGREPPCNGREAASPPDPLGLGAAATARGPVPGPASRRRRAPGLPTTAVPGPVVRRLQAGDGDARMSWSRDLSVLAAIAAAALLVVPVAADARGGGASPPQGRGPGGGYDYRRNSGPPGLGYPYSAPRSGTAPRRFVPAPGGVDQPRRDPDTGYMVPRRGYGVGRPGWRGRGPSPYPGHRQYGNPPGIPPGR